MSRPQETIERIRRTEYLIGVELSPEAAQGARNMRVNLDNALRTLSEDLYSKDTHFVLELIQNADDNEYVRSVHPEICFRLSGDRLVVENNEVGFAERHVLALCRVGQSTKKKEKRSGYIGEKGIGFKSVFTVTDRPEVHSNGFHFCFDRTDPDFALGYVVPTWCGDAGYSNKHTTLVLPAKAGKRFGEETLSELSAELLLFLRKLRKIHIEDDIQKDRRVYARADAGDVVTLTTEGNKLKDGTSSTDERRFKYIQHVYSTAGIKEEKRQEISEAAVVLAFPLNETGNPAAEKSQSLFAFLPVRDYGFRFLIQGDFLLSSNREDIHKNSAWNKRARDEISSAFLKALEAFKADPILSLSYLQFVPRKGDIVDPFFSDAADKIVEALKNADCLKSASGAWKKPSEVITAEPEFKELFPNDDLKRVLGLEYVADAVDAPSGTLERLGVKTAGVTAHMLALIAKDATLASRPVPWLKKLYRYCDKKLVSDAVLKAFQGILAVKLDSGAMHKLADSAIYFPLQAGKRYGFEHELPLLNPDLLVGEGADEVRKFLARAGVRRSEPYWLVIHHILPKHGGESWKTSGIDAIVGHVTYVKDHLAEYLKASEATGEARDAAISRLASGLFLHSEKVENGRTFFSKASQMYLADAFNPPVRLQRMLGPQADPVRFVSKAYMTSEEASEETEHSDAKHWREFFYQLGVNAYPLVEEVSDGAGIDYKADAELTTLLHGEGTPARRRVIELIDRNWDYYSKFLQARVVPRRGYPTLRDSQFLRSLRSAKAPCRKKGDHNLADTCLDVEHVRAVFGDSATFLDAEVGNEEFLDAVGVTHRVDAAACIKHLDQLRENERPNLRSIKTIYRELERLWEKERSLIENALREQPRIYVPARKTWYPSTAVVWEYGGDFIDAHCPSLETAYREHQSFFRRLPVSRHPTEAALISALAKLGEFGETFEGRKGEALKVYRRLARSLRDYQVAGGEGEPEWFDALRSEQVFLDHANRLADPSNDMYIGDDPRLAEALQVHEQISVLAVDHWHLPQLMEMLTLAGMPKISAAAKYELSAADASAIDLEATRRIRQRSTHLIRLLYARAHASFDRMARQGLWAALKKMEVREVPLLEVQASVNDHRVTLAADTYRDNSTIYLQAGTKARFDKLAHELCLFLGVRPEMLSDSVYRVLTAQSDEELQEFFDVKGVSDIPVDELARLTQSEEQPDERADAPSGDDEIGGSAELEDVPDENTTETLSDDSRHSATGAKSGHGSAESSNAQGTSSTEAPDKPAGSSGSSGASGGHSGSGGSTTPAGSATGSGSGVQRDRDRRRSGRAVTYAAPNSPAEKRLDEEVSEQRLAVAKAAVAFVLETERGDGRNVIEMPFLNEGFDIRRITGDIEEFIEVKGLTGAWDLGGIAMTPPELRMAEKAGTRYWLYVVEYALDAEKRLLHKIPDPYGKVDQFRFDAGWKGLVAGRAHALEPSEERRISIDGVGSGIILSVEQVGMFRRINVRLDSGEELQNRIFDPAKMTVAEAQ